MADEITFKNGNDSSFHRVSLFLAQDYEECYIFHFV